MTNNNEIKKIKKTKFNLIVLGEGDVGKTSLIAKIKGKDIEEPTISTVGIDYHKDERTFEGVKYKYKIFDTAGQERFRSIATSTIKSADGFLIVFAVNCVRSFEQVKYWISQVEEETDLQKKPSILVGNKIDLPRKVSNEEGLKYSQDLGIKYFETSALTGYNVKEVFDELYKDIYNSNITGNENLKIRKVSKGKKKKKCC